MSNRILSKSEFSGFVSCLMQVSNIRTFLDNRELDRGEFLRLLAQKDTDLAKKVGVVFAAMDSMRAHVEERANEGLQPSLPLRLGTGGFAG